MCPSVPDGPTTLKTSDVQTSINMARHRTAHLLTCLMRGMRVSQSMLCRFNAVIWLLALCAWSRSCDALLRPSRSSEDGLLLHPCILLSNLSRLCCSCFRLYLHPQALCFCFLLSSPLRLRRHLRDLRICKQRGRQAPRGGIYPHGPSPRHPRRYVGHSLPWCTTSSEAATQPG